LAAVVQSSLRQVPCLQQELRVRDIFLLGRVQQLVADFQDALEPEVFQQLLQFIISPASSFSFSRAA